MPESDQESNQFYRRSMQLLQEAEMPFLLGGAFALCIYTGIVRQTKDFDLFVRPNDIDAALEVFRRAGWRTEKTFPHWLGKVFGKGDCIDIIYRAGNGLSAVDDLWFERARLIEVFGIPASICPPEEMIWMKAYIMERERFDGADVAHLLFHCALQIDWDHLLWRFGPDWRVLLSHLILFGFIYPTQRDRIPPAVIGSLTSRLDEEEDRATGPPICRGTLLSRAQYLTDLGAGGFRDARLESRAGLTPAELEAWTQAIDDQVKPHSVAPAD